MAGPADEHEGIACGPTGMGPDGIGVGPGRRPRVPWLLWAFRAAVLALVLVAGWQLRARIPYPWDLYVWSESTFLTNMLKLDRGLPIFSPPSEANSFVYSPGLEYLTFALLRPMGRHLDIRYCRLVSVGFAALAAFALARASRLLSEEWWPGEAGRLFTPTAAGLFFLVIFRNFTADVPHPDNLYIWHAGLTLLVTLTAVRRRSMPLGVGAMLVAGAGVLLKQVAVFAPIGVALALAFGLGRGRRPTLALAAALLALGALASAGSLALLWTPRWGRFYTFQVVSGHGVDLPKLAYLFKLSASEPHRLLPLLLFPGALAASSARSRGPASRLLATYLLVGAFEVGPTFLAFLKPMGIWNNLVIAWAWMLIPVVPWLLHCLRGLPPGTAEGPEARFARLATSALGLATVLALCPVKAKPTGNHYRHCWAIQRRVSDDLRAGRRVLVAHGTAYLIRGGGPPEVPLDRANSFLELCAAGRVDQADTHRRIREGYYDTIYLNSRWYGDWPPKLMRQSYRVVAEIPGVKDLGWERGFQNDLYPETLVLERLPHLRPPAPMTDHSAPPPTAPSGRLARRTP